MTGRAEIEMKRAVCVTEIPGARRRQTPRPGPGMLSGLLIIQPIFCYLYKITRNKAVFLITDSAQRLPSLSCGSDGADPSGKELLSDSDPP